MKPSILVSKLKEIGVDSLCKLILSYLRGRPQHAQVGERTVSDTFTTYIGAPQGCVLSPVLFTLYTNCHRGKEPYTFNSKYTDDAAKTIVPYVQFDLDIIFKVTAASLI